MEKVGENYTWGHIVCMELDLSGSMYTDQDGGRLKYGVIQEQYYTDYTDVKMNVLWDDIKRVRMRMCVWLKGYEAGVQLLEYYEDDIQVVDRQKTESVMEF